MSNEISTRLTFKVDAKQLKQATEQLSRLQRRLKGMKSAGDASSASLNKVRDSIARLVQKVAQLDGSFTKVTKVIRKGKIATDSLVKAIKKDVTITKKATKTTDQLAKKKEKLAKSAKGATDKIKKGNKAMKGAGDSAKKTGSSLGFTGLAFGFIGGAAAFAGNQIRQVFTTAITESAKLMSEINRISIFSDTGIIDGKINLQGFNTAFERTIDLGNEYGIVLEKAATLLKDVEKAAPTNIDTSALADIAAGLSILENNTNISGLIADFTTVSANFPELPLEEIADQTFAFSKATKLNFNAGGKAIAFAAQSAKRLNTPLNEVLTVLAQIVAAVPGDRGNAGRSVRALISNLTDPDTIAFLKQFGVEIFDVNNKFVGLDAILTGVASKYHELNEANQQMGNAFIKTLGLTKNSITGMLAFANATEEAKAAFKAQFDQAGGQFSISVDDQKNRPEETLNRFRNFGTQLKAVFASGVFPAVAELNMVLKDLFGDKELLDGIKLFGTAIGDTLVTAFNLVMPPLRFFADLLKGNEVVIRLAAVALTGLVGALTAMSVLFPLLGALFALQFLHEKLILRFTQLGTQATFMTRAYGGLNLRVNALTASMKGLFVTGISVDQMNQKQIASLTGLQIATLKLQIHISMLTLRFKLLLITLKANIVGFLKFSALIFTNPVRALAVLRLSLKNMRVSFLIFGGQVKKAGLALIGFSKKAVTSSIASLGKLGKVLKIAAVNFKIFAVSAITSLLAVAAAWIVAFAPIIIAIGIFIVAIGLMRLFQDEIVGIADSLDSTGNAGRNFAANMDGLFDFLSTGDLTPFFDALKADFVDTQTRFSAFGNAWNQLISDLQRSDLGIWIRETIGNIKAFLTSITFNVPSGWELLQAISISIGGLFFWMTGLFNNFLRAMGVDVPSFYDNLDGWLKSISHSFEFILFPLREFKKSLDFEVPKVYAKMIEAIDKLKASWKGFVDSIGENPIVKSIMQLLGIGGQAIRNADLGKTLTGPRGEGRIDQAESFFPGPDNSRGPGAGITPAFEVESFGSGLFDSDTLARLNESYGIQAEIVELATVGLIEQGEAILLNTEFLGTTNENLEESNEIAEEGVILGEKNNILSKFQNKLSTKDNQNTTVGNGLALIDNALVDIHSILLKDFNLKIGLGIIEYIRNINEMSSLTSMLAQVKITYANIIAQGNRAAGKLASAWMDSKGIWHYTDPGVSAGDQNRINSAQNNYATTKANQIYLQLKIDINPTINIENGSSEEAASISADLAAELSEQLQKRISMIS